MCARHEGRPSEMTRLLLLFVSTSLFILVSLPGYIASPLPAPPAFFEMFDGLSTNSVPNPGVRAIATSPHNFTANQTAIQTVDGVYYGSSYASSLGQYDCQLYTCYLGSNCNQVGGLSVTWTGFEQIPTPVTLFYISLSFFVLFILFLFYVLLFYVSVMLFYFFYPLFFQIFVCIFFSFYLILFILYSLICLFFFQLPRKRIKAKQNKTIQT